MKKLDHKWLGPYPINKVISCNAYSLEFPSSFGHTHPVFSVVLLLPYPVPECHTPPPPLMLFKSQQRLIVKDGNGMCPAPATSLCVYYGTHRLTPRTSDPG